MAKKVPERQDHEIMEMVNNSDIYIVSSAM